MVFLCSRLPMPLHSPAPTVLHLFPGSLCHGIETPARDCRPATETKMSAPPLHRISNRPLKELTGPSQFGPLMLLHVSLMGCVHLLESSLPPSSRIMYPLTLLPCTSQPPVCYFPPLLGSEPSGGRACPRSSTLGHLGEKSSSHTSF